MKYVIINSNEVDSVDFSKVQEISENTLRYSLDGTKTFLKFDSDTTPSFLEGKTQYTHSEILTILATDEWSDPNPPGE
tara:strand:+ start:508 stop:741 length:234 start_codon:yes stop_codon:yes gene_type:complete